MPEPLEVIYKGRMGARWQVTLDHLRDILSEPVGFSDPGPEALERAVRDAYELSRAAFERGEPEARLFAERVMHVIQAHSHWAPPMHALPACYWGVLIRAKMNVELKLPPGWGHLTDGADALTTDELKRRLEAAVAEFGCHNHPLLDDIAHETGNRAMLSFAKNWYGSCQGFAAQLVQLVQRTTGEVRKSVAANVTDEFAAVSHDELRMRFIESVGFHYDPVVAATDGDRVCESYALMSFRTALCVINDPLYALGSFYTTEANWPTECKRMLTGLRQRGSSERDVEYWTTHAYADEHHAAEWLDVLLPVATTPADRKRALTGALAQLHIRRRMYDSIRARAR
jgi:pyrroloquinoline quinone (PQQ) biosynthesis protein C